MSGKPSQAITGTCYGDFRIDDCDNYQMREDLLVSQIDENATICQGRGIHLRRASVGRAFGEARTEDPDTES